MRHRRRFGQDTGRVLEGSRAQEAFGFQRGLGDAQQHRLRFGGFATHLLDALILVLELDLVDLFAPEEAACRPVR